MGGFEAGRLAPVFDFATCSNGVDSGRAMEFAGFGEELFVGELPCLEYDIEIFLDVAGTGKAPIADFEAGEFGEVVIGGVAAQEVIHDLPIASVERMLLVPSIASRINHLR